MDIGENEMMLAAALNQDEFAYCPAYDIGGALRAFAIVDRQDTLENVYKNFLRSDKWIPGEPSHAEWAKVQRKPGA